MRMRLLSSNSLSQLHWAHHITIMAMRQGFFAIAHPLLVFGTHCLWDQTSPSVSIMREALHHTLWTETERLGLLYARKEHPCRALAKRTLRHQDKLLHFVRVIGLAADSNLAKRSVRPWLWYAKSALAHIARRAARHTCSWPVSLPRLKTGGLNPSKAVSPSFRSIPDCKSEQLPGIAYLTQSYMASNM